MFSAGDETKTQSQPAFLVLTNELSQRQTFEQLLEGCVCSETFTCSKFSSTIFVLIRRLPNLGAVSHERNFSILFKVPYKAAHYC